MMDNRYDINSQMIIDAAHTWSKALCECAGYDDEFAEEFWRRLRLSSGVYSEYVYYMINQNFACQYKIGGVSLVDIMVWQIDHFKASMDMDREQKRNPDLMLLTAFISMLDMEDNPEKELNRIYTDTGTDYPGKF